jgi:hypothetical protein
METKKQFKYFSIFSYEKEQEYLDQMHRSGWKFVKVSGLGMYHFEKCQPQSVAYRLDYNKEGLAHKEEYVKLYSDCGWEYIQDYAGYSYFRKPEADMVGNEEIFCDESSRQAMLDRVYKGRVLPLFVLFSACILPQFVLQLIGGEYMLAAIMGTLVAIYSAFFGYSAVHYHRKKSKGQ